MKKREGAEGGPGSGPRHRDVGKDKDGHPTHYYTRKKIGGKYRMVKLPYDVEGGKYAQKMHDKGYSQGGESRRESAPPGREDQVRKLKKKVGVPGAFKIAWSQHNNESRTQESNRDDDSEQYNMMGDFINNQHKGVERINGWKNPGVYMPPQPRKQETSGVVIKEF